MASEPQWTLEYDKKLITLLREFPLLWNTTYPAYTNSAQREMAWKQLEEKLNLPIFKLRDLKTRLYFYRRNYCEEYNKMLNSSYETSFELFKSLQFLFKHETENKDTLQSGNTVDIGEVIFTDYGTDDVAGQAVERSTLPSKDEFTLFGENIAKELQAMSKYNHIKLDFKYKVMAAILEANEALIKINRKT